MNLTLVGQPQILLLLSNLFPHFVLQMLGQKSNYNNLCNFYTVVTMLQKYLKCWTLLATKFSFFIYPKRCVLVHVIYAIAIVVTPT